ncbi:hypothetical protein L6164_004655 [Bauhinia variegata]|uniref:Uncharacterized protein n=1 Tax=Bauhinia variegata TaxID=167791 RepID=A0ACB9Q537_BAUVA|nr:hypothetical protein L6164_004655 [Bauhinia variegata]
MLSELLGIHTYSALPIPVPRNSDTIFLCINIRCSYSSRTRRPRNPHSSSNSFRLYRGLSYYCRPLRIQASPLGNSNSNSNSEPVLNSQSESELKDAQNAVSTFLHQLGLSEEESQSIASNSPKYLRMLVDGVRDLDELSMWNSNSWKGEEENVDGFQFQDKVLHIARGKSDNGKVAFLESLGFSLSSAMNVARYLSAETLTALVHKVKCMKELFFSGSDNEDFPVKNVRRMMMQLSIPIDEDLQQTLSFFEKVEAKRGGLNMLHSKDASFHYLIESFPRLLLLSVKYRIIPIMEFLENIGISRGRIRNVILVFPPMLLWNIDVFKTRVRALKEIGIVVKDYAKVLLKYPWILSTSIQENYKEVLSLLDSEKVPKACIDRAIKSWPHLLGSSTSNLRLMLDQFFRLGVQEKNLDRVVVKSPQLLLMKPQDFLQVIVFLENMGLDKESIGKILARCPHIFAASISKTLQRKIEFLRKVGISEVPLPRVIKMYPQLLVADTNRTVLPRVIYLMKLGLSQREIVFMVRSFPPLLGYSIEEVLRPKIEFLVNAMERPVRHVVGYPRYFSHSLEKKIKPRYLVLKGRNIKWSLKDMLGKNDEEFAADLMGVENVIMFLENMGLDKESIGKILARCPEIFAASISETLRGKIEFLRKVGISEVHLPRVIKMYPQLLVADTNRTVLPRVIYLMKLGLSQKEIAFMVCCFPPLLGYSIEEVLRPKIEFLVNTMERPVRHVVGYPKYFSHSLEKKIKPRYLVLKGRNIKWSLKDMLGKNDEEFAADFMGVENVLV